MGRLPRLCGRVRPGGPPQYYPPLIAAFNGSTKRCAVEGVAASRDDDGPPAKRIKSAGSFTAENEPSSVPAMTSLTVTSEPALDSTAFPDLLDLIVTYSSPPVQRAIRATSRYWAKALDPSRLMLRYVLDDDRPAECTVLLSTPGGRVLCGLACGGQNGPTWPPADHAAWALFDAFRANNYLKEITITGACPHDSPVTDWVIEGLTAYTQRWGPVRTSNQAAQGQRYYHLLYDDWFSDQYNNPSDSSDPPPAPNTFHLVPDTEGRIIKPPSVYSWVCEMVDNHKARAEHFAVDSEGEDDDAEGVDAGGAAGAANTDAMWAPDGAPDDDDWEPDTASSVDSEASDDSDDFAPDDDEIDAEADPGVDYEMEPDPGRHQALQYAALHAYMPPSSWTERFLRFPITGADLQPLRTTMKGAVVVYDFGRWVPGQHGAPALLGLFREIMLHAARTCVTERPVYLVDIEQLADDPALEGFPFTEPEDLPWVPYRFNPWSKKRLRSCGYHKGSSNNTVSLLNFLQYGIETHMRQMLPFEDYGLNEDHITALGRQIEAFKMRPGWMPFHHPIYARIP